MQDCKECFSISPWRGEVGDAHVGVAINHSLTPQQQSIFSRRVIWLARHKYIPNLNTWQTKNTTIWQFLLILLQSSIRTIGFSIQSHSIKTAAIMSFHTEKCCYLVSAYKASVWCICRLQQRPVVSDLQYISINQSIDQSEMFNVDRIALAISKSTIAKQCQMMMSGKRLLKQGCRLPIAKGRCARGRYSHRVYTIVMRAKKCLWWRSGWANAVGQSYFDVLFQLLVSVVLLPVTSGLDFPPSQVMSEFLQKYCWKVLNTFGLKKYYQYLLVKVWAIPVPIQ